MKTDGAGQTVPLRFRKYGDAANPKLIILHGLFGSGVNWRTVATQLSASHEVFCPDLRNHGRSPWHDEMNYRALGGDVSRFIADHRLQGAALLGHSMGGKTAMTLAQARSTALAKLVIIDIAPAPYPAAGHLGLIDAMRAVNLDAAAGRRQLDAALATRIPDPAVRRFLAQNLVKEGNRYHWRINLEALRRNLDALAGYADERQSPVDALFIAGAQSDYLRPDGHAGIFKRFPNARIETIENAGHWLHAEQPGRLVALCRAFLAG